MDPILQQLQPIFQDVLDQPDLVLTPASNASTVEHFKIRFALGELQELKNVGDMVDLIQKKLAAK